MLFLIGDKMKILKLILTLLFIVLILTGCSVTDIGEVSNYGNTMVSQMIIDANIENKTESQTSENALIDGEDESKNDVKPDNNLNVGENFGVSIDIEREDGTKETIGQRGLRYTINSVTVYENIYESGVEFNVWNLSWDPVNKEYFISEDQHNSNINNMFILLDFTATYNAPENGKDEITVNFENDMLAISKDEKMKEGWLDEFATIREKKIYISSPYISYYSGAPLPKDVDTYMDQDDMLPTIKDGETISFQIGITCWEKFVESKNVYLQINGYNPNFIDNYDGYYVALIPEE